MRDVFAILAIIAAVVGLGVFRVPGENALVVAGIRVAAEGAVYQARHPISISVDGREVTARGRVDTISEGEAIMARLARLHGVRSVVNRLTVLPDVAPFVLRMEKNAFVTLTGHVPQAGLATRLARRLDVEELELPVAVGAPDHDWGNVALAGAEALSIMLDGRVVLRDRRMALVGRVHLPADLTALQARMAELPDQYTATLAIEVVDDGLPYSLQVLRDPHLGLEMVGKLPPDFDLNLLSFMGPAQRSDLRIAPLPLDQPGFTEAVTVAAGVVDDLPQGSLTVAPGLVSLTGGPVSPELVEQAEGLRDRLPEGYALHLALVPEDDGTPWALEVTWDGAALHLSGRVPRDFDPATVSERHGAPLGASTLSFAPYPDLRGWAAPLDRGLRALSRLREGDLVLADDGLTLTGIADNPAARRHVARALDPGKMAVLLADDGAPPVFTLLYDPAAGASVRGKLPNGLTPAAMADVLGLATIRGTPAVSPDGAAAPVLDLLARARPVLPLLDGLRFEHAPGALHLDLTPLPGLAPKAVSALLPTQDAPGTEGEALAGPRVQVLAPPQPLSGSRRMHALLQEPQIFVDGHWLPELGLTPTQDACREATLRLPDLPFAPGSFRPPGSAYWQVADFVALARACTRFGALPMVVAVDVGSSTFPALNRQLARRRAEALRDMFIARGVSPLSVTAQGMAGERDKVTLIWAQ